MSNNQKFLLFLLGWLILNIYTAANTELYEDEAYYWMYSRFLDWGYFDHPPFVALMIKSGSWLGKNELAVRIVNVLLTSLSLYLIYYLVKPKNVLVFAFTLFGFLIFHIIGFVSSPDGPLLFFSIIYLYVYHRFIQKETLLNLFLVGLFAALLLYAKYQGGLVILLSIASYPKVLKHYGIYLAGLIAFILVSPHIFWQYNHNFPSFTYHLVSRSSSHYKISQTLEYFFGNIPFHGGLIALALFVGTFYLKSTSLWERLLKWNLYGVLVFFFLITFKGQRIEPNWTLTIAFPLILLGYHSIEKSPYFKAYKNLVFVFFPIMLLFRIHLAYPLIDIKKDRVWDFHYGSQFAKNIEALSDGRYLVANRYQDASFLNFYLDKDYIVPSINISSRDNQYGIWQFEKKLCGENIAFVNDSLPGTTVKTLMETTKVSLLEDVFFPNCYRIKFTEAIIHDDTLKIMVESPEYLSDGASDNLSQLDLSCELYEKDTLIMQIDIPATSIIKKNEEAYYAIHLKRKLNIQSIELSFFSEKLGGHSQKKVVYKVSYQ